MSNIFEFDDEFEKEFKNTCEIIRASQPVVNVTLDGLWTEEDLDGNVDDEVMKMKDEFDKYQHRAVYDKNLLSPGYMIGYIQGYESMIDRYNKEASKDRTKFGIAMFDIWIHTEVKNLLKGNLVK